ncbi:MULTISPECIES: hypothetical protein [unclassified Meridianimarinicoccus]|uniref:hypothetical protein n=1 Tax=unclassified Meridianimarinicoccus TaxID=2923344 RepID=UPI0018679D0E|nr:hypothetical protein [Fluviibacterium sp. MJW13]
MHLRLFKCPNCGHHMRLGGTRCRRCYSEKPVVYSASFIAFLGFVSGLIAVAYLTYWVATHIPATQ